jgi:hypothetical protein
MAGERSVSIGRDAVGNVITTGDHNDVTANVTVSQHRGPLVDPATVDIAKELAAIREILASLSSEHVKKIDHALDEASDEATKQDAADKDELGKALDRALDYAKRASTFATVATKLAPHLGNAVAWLGSTWHALLRYVA